MICVTYRQFRTQALAALAVLAAATLYFVITGQQMHHAYTADLVGRTRQNDCDFTLNTLQDNCDGALELAQLLVIAAPALIGIFWGAPLIGRELETGTHQLAWNQSVMRTRWLAVKLTGTGTGTGIAAIAIAGPAGSTA
jgi:hypothetical protein